MINTDINLTIRPKVVTGAERPLHVVAERFKAIGAQIHATETKVKVLVSRLVTGAGLAEVSWRKAGHGIATGIGYAIGAIERMGGAVSGLMGKLFNLRNVIAGSFLGMAAFKGVSALFRAGEGNLKADRRVRRQFGDVAGARINAAAAGMYKYGVGDDDASNALVPIAEAIETTQAGSKFGGRTLTAAQAARAREQTMARALDLYQRASAFAPDVDPEHLGLLIAQAGTGKEGMKGLVSALHLNKATVAQMEKANEKGNLAALLKPGEAAQYGIKSGQKAGRGTLLDLILARHGITQEGADDEMKTFTGQVKSLGALLENALGNVGAAAMTKLNERFAKGSTLAEKLKAWMESDRGKKFIDDLTNGIVKIVDGVIKFGDRLPGIISDLEKFKEPIMWIAGIFGAGKVLGGAISTASFFAELQTTAPLMGSAIGVAIAGAVGLAIGTWLNNKLGISDGIVDAVAGGPNAESRRSSKLYGGDAQQSALFTYATNLQRKVASGELTGQQAAAQASAYAQQIEGQGAGRLSKFSRGVIDRLEVGDTGLLTGTSADRARLGRLTDSGERARVQVNIGQIGVGVGMTRAEIVQSVMPEIERQLTYSLDAATAGGAAPISSGP